MSFLVCDIETRPNPAMIETFKGTSVYKKWVEGQGEMDSATLRKFMATDTDFCEIVCIGIRQVDGETRIVPNIETLATPEWVNILQQLTLVTFNGKRFDIPVLIKAGLRKGLELPYRRLAAACKPWGYGERHVDMMEQLAFGGQYKSLDTYLQAYLGLAKETKGAEFFDKATDEEIIEHCRQDLEYTEKLFKFMAPIL